MWIKSDDGWHCYRAVVGDNDSFEKFMCGKMLRAANLEESEERETSEKFPYHSWAHCCVKCSIAEMEAIDRG